MPFDTDLSAALSKLASEEERAAYAQRWLEDCAAREKEMVAELLKKIAGNTSSTMWTVENEPVAARLHLLDPRDTLARLLGGERLNHFVARLGTTVIWNVVLFVGFLATSVSLLSDVSYAGYISLPPTFLCILTLILRSNVTLIGAIFREFEFWALLTLVLATGGCLIEMFWDRPDSACAAASGTLVMGVMVMGDARPLLKTKSPVERLSFASVTAVSWLILILYTVGAWKEYRSTDVDITDVTRVHIHSVCMSFIVTLSVLCTKYTIAVLTTKELHPFVLIQSSCHARISLHRLGRGGGDGGGGGGGGSSRSHKGGGGSVTVSTSSP